MSGNFYPSIPEILVANGVNLDLLGQRDPEIYGKKTLVGIQDWLSSQAEAIARLAGFSACRLHFYQSNSEERFLEKIAEPFDAILLNPGAWTHTSLALGDRLMAIGTPYLEVHLSHLSKREGFRQSSWTAAGAIGVIHGLGAISYSAGLLAILQHLRGSTQQEADPVPSMNRIRTSN